MCEPMDEWQSKFYESINLEKSRMDSSPDQTIGKITTSPEASLQVGNDFSFASESLGAEDDDELTKSKIRGFLDENVLL